MASALPNPYKQRVYYDLREAPVLFEKFIKDYNRHYKDVEDKYAHYFAFFMNLVEINKLNQDSEINGGATFSINQFADYTKEEFKQMNGLIPPLLGELHSLKLSLSI